MKTLGLIKEDNELKIVALTPTNVDNLSEMFMVNVEQGAGEAAGFPDESYVQAGAKILTSRRELIRDSELIITYSSIVEIAEGEEPKVIIACYPIRDDYSFLLPYNHKRVDMFSLDLVPRSTIAQSMDPLSSLASLNGYQAAITSFWHFESVIPLISGAGGTLKPAKVLVLGAGVAGLQAIATAKRMGAQVFAFDVRNETKEEVESLGATFIEISGADQSSLNDGYAMEQRRAYNQKVNETIESVIMDMDIVITTAKVPGKEAPELISEESINRMKEGSILVDLASDTGGNCRKSVDGENILYDGILIIGESRFFNKIPRAASTLLGNNFQKFIEHLINHDDDILHDDILQQTMVFQQGEIINKKILNEVKEL